jgi:hypothetical protein
MTTSEFKELFNEQFYYPTYQRWRINNEKKAAKDIVGEQYELFRKSFYEKLGYEIGNGKKIFGSSYNCDVVVRKEGKVVLLEEAKASYVDSCFLGRAIQNAAQVYNTCLKQNIDIPTIIISSSTRYNKYEEIYKEKVETHREDLMELLNKKFIYLPLCDHDRIPRKRYFTTKESCFNLSDELIDEQIKFIKGVAW